MLEASGLGGYVVRAARPGDPTSRPTSTAWRALVDRIKAPEADRRDRPRRQVRRAARRLHVASPRRSATPAWAHEVDVKVRWVNSEALDPRRTSHDATRGRRRHRRAGRLRPSRHRGQGPRRPLRPRAPHPVPRPVPRPADGGHRVRPQGRRHRRRQLDRVRPRSPTPGHRLHARPARHGGQGRHDAPRPLSLPSSTPGSKAAAAYGEEVIYERHRHRFEVNNATARRSRRPA